MSIYLSIQCGIQRENDGISIIILGVKLLKDSIMDRLRPSKVVRRAITDRLAVLIITSQLLPLHRLRNYLI